METKVKIKKTNRNEKGITLIALVVTIVVLLILAGVSINLIISNGGIISKSKEATERTKEAQDNTQLFFNGVVDEIDNALGVGVISEEEFEKNPTNYRHPDQKENTEDSAIGTDGKSVNMDLWSYMVLDDGGVRLGNFGHCGGYNKGYQNENITADGKIIGTVPKMIYVASENKVLPVTEMIGTFYGCTNLVIAPEIPEGVTELEGTFEECSKLTKAPKIPESVESLFSTFDSCTSLAEAPEIPTGVKYMNGAFRRCTSLEVAPTIPEGVDTMEATFEYCTNLKTVPTIPESVTYMCATFEGCTSLTGTITINAKLRTDEVSKRSCFEDTEKPIVLKGLSPYLAELAATATNGNVTVEQ